MSPSLPALRAVPATASAAVLALAVSLSAAGAAAAETPDPTATTITSPSCGASCTPEPTETKPGEGRADKPKGPDEPPGQPGGPEPAPPAAAQPTATSTPAPPPAESIVPAAPDPAESIARRIRHPGSRNHGTRHHVLGHCLHRIKLDQTRHQAGQANPGRGRCPRRRSGNGRAGPPDHHGRCAAGGNRRAGFHLVGQDPVPGTLTDGEARTDGR